VEGDVAVNAPRAGAPAIVALGEAMVEFNQTRGESPNQYLLGFGGDTSNMAIAVARLAGRDGPRAGYVSRVGADTFGRMLLDLWQSEGVDTSGVSVDAQAPTGVYFVTHGERGHDFSYLRAGSAASRMSPATLPLDVIRGAQVLHVSGISQAISTSACDAVFAAIDAARGAGVRVSYDPNFRPKLWPFARGRAIVVATAAQCDWLLPSLEEAQQLSGREEPAAIIDWCHALGAGIVALKLGARGCVVSDGARIETLPGYPVRAVDATGAGDCFDGAFALRMIESDDPFAAARFANVAAAIATTGYGAVAPLPRRADVLEHVR
jgi:2-dehydro-3-deoxygluconokinase